MIDVRGQPLLRRQVSLLNAAGVRKVTVVRGYRKEAIDLKAIETVDNDRYAETGELYSLNCARAALDGPCLVAYGDILYRDYMLDALLRAEGDIVIVADALWRDGEQPADGQVRDLVICDREYSTDYLVDGPVYLRHAGADVARDAATGEWIGLLKLSADGAAWVTAALDAMATEDGFEQADMPGLLNRLIADDREVRVKYITGQWLDIDNTLDLAHARNLL
jgi:phosphoenolpyruvate phosphomutase